MASQLLTSLWKAVKPKNKSERRATTHSTIISKNIFNQMSFYRNRWTLRDKRSDWNRSGNSSECSSLSSSEDLTNRSLKISLNGEEVESRTAEEVDSEEVFRRDSFEDRICDDLCQLILNFLPLEDKIRQQWVCPQWRRVILQYEREMSVLPFVCRRIYRMSYWNDDEDLKEEVDLFTLVPVLHITHNLRYVSRLYGYKNSEVVMAAIVRFCDRLVAIETDFDISDQMLNKFLKKFGQKMKKILFTKLIKHKKFVHILRSCPSLEVIGRDHINIWHFFDGAELLVSNLKTMSLYSNESPELYHRMLVGNKDSLRRVETYISNDFRTFEDILSINKLKHLSLAIQEVDRDFFKFVDKMTSNCLKLFKFKATFLRIDKSVGPQDWKSFFKSVNCFTELRSLKINDRTYGHDMWDFNLYLPDEEDILQLLCKQLNNLRRLKSLKIISGSFAIDDKFFYEIEKCVPNVQKLYLQCRHITGQIAQSLSKLRFLRFVCLCQVIPGITLIDVPKRLTEKDVLELIAKNPKIIRLFLTTPCPGRMTCDLSDRDIDLIRRKGCSDAEALFLDDGQEEWDRNSFSRSSYDFDRKLKLTSANWNY